MNELKGFEFETKKIRTVFDNDETWFVLKDICEILGIEKHRDAASRLNTNQRGSAVVDTPGGIQEMITINESGLYKLIFQSRKPEAEKFSDWVTSIVLPSIRKTGSYGIALPKTFAEALRLAADQAEQIETMKPKALSYDKFISGNNVQTVNQVAKILGTGEIKLFQFLREEKIFYKIGTDNMPYQKYIDTGYFVVKENPIKIGSTIINKPQIFVTAKGVEFINKIISEV